MRKLILIASVLAAPLIQGDTLDKGVNQYVAKLAIIENAEQIFVKACTDINGKKGILCNDGYCDSSKAGRPCQGHNGNTFGRNLQVGSSASMLVGK